MSASVQLAYSKLISLDPHLDSPTLSLRASSALFVELVPGLAPSRDAQVRALPTRHPALRSQSSQHPPSTLSVLHEPQLPEVAHQGTGQFVVVQLENVSPLYVCVSRQYTLWVLVEPVGSGTLFWSRSQTVASTPATPIMCHGSRLLSYTGATTVVIAPRCWGWTRTARPRVAFDLSESLDEGVVFVEGYHRALQPRLVVVVVVRLGVDGTRLAREVFKAPRIHIT